MYVWIRDASRMVVIAVALLALLVSVGSVVAVPPAQDWETAVATLEVTAGSVEIVLPNGNGDPVAFVEGDFVPIAPGDQITVSDDGEAYLTFFEGAETRLTAGTVIVVEQFERAGEAVQINFSVLAGQTLSAVHTTLDAESKFEVNTPAAAITVRGTEFVVFVRPDQLTQVATLDGIVMVEKDGESAEVWCGYGLKVAPDGPLGEINVWGQLVLDVVAPVDDTTGIPVTMFNRTLEQDFRYHTGDVMFSVVLGGPYDLVLHTPGPVRLTDLVFPEDSPPMTMESAQIVLGALEVQVVDAAGSPVDAGDLVVRLTRLDLTNTTVTAPGEPLLAGPGTWTAEIALASNPDQVVVQPVNIPRNGTVTLSVPLSALEG